MFFAGWFLKRWSWKSLNLTKVVVCFKQSVEGTKLTRAVKICSFEVIFIVYIITYTNFMKSSTVYAASLYTFVRFETTICPSIKFDISLQNFKKPYYSCKIFPRFWLAKSTRIIHHNQLLMTKFGRILCLMRIWRQKCSRYRLRHRYREDLGTRLSCFGSKNKNGRHFTCSLVSRVRTTAGTRQNNS